MREAWQKAKKQRRSRRHTHNLPSRLANLPNRHKKTKEKRMRIAGLHPVHTNPSIGDASQPAARTSN